jgi:hypothetical protein
VALPALETAEDANVIVEIAKSEWASGNVVAASRATADVDDEMGGGVAVFDHWPLHPYL